MDATQLEQLLVPMTRAGASSLHLIPGHRPCIRVQRQFVQSEQPPVTTEGVETITRQLLLDDHRERLRRDGQVEVLYVARSGQRFRTTVMQQEAGVSMLLRPVPEAPPSLQDLELPPPHDPDLGIERYDVIVVCFYLHRALFPALIDALKPNGMLLYETFTIDNYFHHRHPKRWEFCLAHNELLRLTSPLRTLHYDEGEHDGGHGAGSAFTAQLLAQKPPAFDASR